MAPISKPGRSCFGTRPDELWFCSGSWGVPRTGLHGGNASLDTRAPCYGDETVCGVRRRGQRGSRPPSVAEANHSFTNNWPMIQAPATPRPRAPWSGPPSSVAGLVLFLAFILYFHHRYRLEAADVEDASLRFDIRRDDADALGSTSTVKFFVIALLLFLVQTFSAARWRTTMPIGATFYGFPLNDILPFQGSPHLAPAACDLLDRDGLAGHGDLYCSAGRRPRSRADNAHWSTFCSARLWSWWSAA